ncbi:hypothetical protein [Inquilinus limosus]|nr:hypothetical protein [Inquilinus limosus]
MEEMLLQDLSRGKDPLRVSKLYGVPLRLVRELAAKVENKPVVNDRPDLAQYAIASKHVDALWPVNDVIQAAKDEYDAGLVEIVTGRSGSTLTLYRIPRKHQDKKRIPYFSRSEE